MSRLFRRALSTSFTMYAGPSREATLPLAVRRRREEHPAATAPSALTNPDKFVGENAELFPAQMEDEFQYLRSKGNYVGPEDEARARFLKASAAWRARVRGGPASRNMKTGVVRPDTKLEFLAREGEERDLHDESSGYRDTIIGQKIFLPNIQIRLMRNHTPPGEAYDPWVATFRIPPSMTKNDLRSYLSAVYGLDVTFIRTDNYLGPLERVQGGKIKRSAGSKKNYKRAVVGLTEPFHYPDDVEEMRAGTWGGAEAGEQQAKEREAVLDAEYARNITDDYRASIRMKMNKGWRWRTGTHDNAGNTIREIMRRRMEREQSILDQVSAREAFSADQAHHAESVAKTDTPAPTPA